MRLAVTLLAVFILFGCAAKGPAFSSIQDRLPTLDDAHGRVVYYRTHESWGSGMKQYIYLDDNRIGVSQIGGVFYVDVAPGDHNSTLQHKLYPGESALTLHVTAHETVYVETWVGGSGFAGRINQSIREPEQARGDIADLAYTGHL